MDYLIYDEDGELIDVLHFKNHKDLDAYRAKNSSNIIIKAEDMLYIDPNEDDDYDL